MYLARNFLEEQSPPQESRADIVNRILAKGGDAPEIRNSKPLGVQNRLVDKVKSWATVVKSSSSHTPQSLLISIAKTDALSIRDVDFFSGFPRVLETHSSLTDAYTTAKALALTYFENGALRAAKKAAQELRDAALEQIRLEYVHRTEKQYLEEDEQRWNTFRRDLQERLSNPKA